MPGIYLTADLHIGHHLVATQRGFTMTDEHDAMIARRWRTRVQADDEIYVLGDLCVSAARHEEALAFIDALPGRKHLIFGNHDAGHPMHKKWAHTHPGYDAVFATTGALASLTARKTRVLLSHFPYANPDEERYQAWRPVDTGLPLIHGHTHSTQQESFSPRHSPQLHVGLDAWNLTPVPFGAVDTWLKNVLATTAT